MPRYIDANWLLDRAIPIWWSAPKWVSDIKIADAPTADVRENVHAKWIKGCCSKCGYNWGKDAPIASVPNFCPKCGAQMDERIEDVSNC